MSDIVCVLNPAGQNVQQGLSSLPDISRSLPDMSGIFRDHWEKVYQNMYGQLEPFWNYATMEFTLGLKDADKSTAAIV